MPKKIICSPEDKSKIKIEKLIKAYVECAEICARLDLKDKGTIKENNKAAKKMYNIIKKAEMVGPLAISKFAKLLDIPICAKWLSHQLVELATISKEIEDKCFDFIEKRYYEFDHFVGFRIWLDEWYVKKGRKRNIT